MKRLVWLAIPLLMVGCSQADKPAKTNEGGQSGVTETAAVPTATDKNGKQMLSGSGTAVELHHRGDASVSASGKGWSIPEAAKISADSDAFKLKDSSGTTQWKVKMTDKVKILKGEETVTCEISSPETGRFKAKNGSGLELGQVRSEGSGSKIQEADATIGSSPQAPTASLAAMLCGDVPAGPRAVIIAELAKRGR